MSSGRGWNRCCLCPRGRVGRRRGRNGSSSTGSGGGCGSVRPAGTSRTATAPGGRAAADDDHRAGGVVQASDADRADQRVGEPAVTAVAHHEQVGVLRGGQQHPGRVAFGDDLVHGDAGRRADLGDRGAQGLGRQLGIVGVGWLCVMPPMTSASVSGRPPDQIHCARRRGTFGRPLSAVAAGTGPGARQGRS